MKYCNDCGEWVVPYTHDGKVYCNLCSTCLGLESVIF